MVVGRGRGYGLLAVLITALLLFPQTFADERQFIDECETKIGNIINGYKVDFDPPPIVLDCLSFFNLNVTIEKARPNLPSLVLLTVYLYVPSEVYGNRVSIIGLLPYVYIPATVSKVSVTVPCITSNRLFHRLQCFKAGEKDEFELREGYIGVSLLRARNFGIKGIILGALWKMYYQHLMKNDLWLFITSRSFPIKILNSYIISKVFLNWRFSLKLLSPLTIWKRVNVTSPLVCSDKIKFHVLKHSKKTDDKGRFNVTVEIENKLNVDVVASVLVDVSSEPFINALFPTAKVTRYNAGHEEIPLPAGKSIRRTINCSFPPGGFIRKNYTVRVECGPYVPVGNTNQFGIYTFNIRWLGFIKPNYRVNATVQQAIKRFWYNLPIFGKGNETEFLPYEQFEIEYNGETPTSTLEITLNKISKEVKYWIAVMFLAVLILIIIGILGYRFAIKKDK